MEEHKRRSLGRSLMWVFFAFIFGMATNAFLLPNVNLTGKDRVRAQTFRIHEGELSAEVEVSINCTDNNWSVRAEPHNLPDGWGMTSSGDDGEFQQGRDEPKFVIQVDWTHAEHGRDFLLFSGVVPDEDFCK